MKYLKSVVLVPLLIGSTLAARQASACWQAVCKDDSQQVGSAVSLLTQRYESLIHVPDNVPETGGDLQIDCLALTFQDWATAYLAILDRTTVDPKSVGAPLNHFGEIWFGVEDDLKIAEYMRPGVTKVLSDVLEEMRKNPGAPEKLDPSKITLDNVLDRQYFANLKLCLSRELIDKASPHLHQVDPSATVPPGMVHSRTGQVSWITTTNNGIAPIWSDSSPTDPHLLGLFRSVEMTYADYLKSKQEESK